MTAPSALVGADVLRQVKTIELHTRRLVNTLFSGEYRTFLPKFTVFVLLFFRVTNIARNIR